MKLYSQEDIDQFKRLFAGLLKCVFEQTRLIYFTVSVLFFLTWLGLISVLLVSDYDMFFLVIGFFLPFILLVAVLQYKSRVAYSFVLIVFIFVGLQLILRIWQTMNGILYFGTDSLINVPFEYSVHDLNASLEGLLLVVVAIALMHNRRLVVRHGWNRRLFYISFFIAVAAYLVERLYWYIDMYWLV